MYKRYTGNTRNPRLPGDGCRSFVAAALMFILIASITPLHAQNSSTTYAFSSESTLSVEGTSTIHDWSCEVESFSGEVSLSTTDDGPLDAVANTRLTVPIESFECGKNTMNRKLREAFKADDHPELTFESDEIILAAQSSGSPSQLTVRGDLTMAGVTQAIEVTAEGSPTADGRYRFTGQHELDMTNYEMDPPTAVFGTIRTGEVVTVNFEILASHE